MRRTILAAVIFPCALATAGAVEFDAAIGRQGYGRCHMDECGFFIIESVIPIKTGANGTLFAVAQKQWEASYKPTDDGREYDRPPIHVGKPTPYQNLVLCSKTTPMIFDYADNKWTGAHLRPGDETSVFGASESAYTFYYAACHHFITKDATSAAMAKRLGYDTRPAKGDSDVLKSEENAKPLSFVK